MHAILHVVRAARLLAPAIALISSMLAGAMAQDRYALVISVEELATPTLPATGAALDAELVADALANAGFSVRRLDGADRGAIMRATDRLATQMDRDNAVGLVYFAGYAAQVSGRTYLLASDTRTVSSLTLSGSGLAADFFAERLGAASGTAIIVIDADAPADILSNPSFGLTPGLRPFEPTPGGAVILSNLPDRPSSPRRPTDVSVFASAFVSEIVAVDALFSSALNRLVSQVRRDASGARTPWIVNDTPSGFVLGRDNTLSVGETTDRESAERRERSIALPSETEPAPPAPAAEVRRSRGLAPAPAAAQRPAPPPPPTVEAEVILEPDADTGLHHVRVFFGTDRAVDFGGADVRFTNDDAGDLTFGAVEVTLPPNHKPGVLETPRWWRFEFSEDETIHVVLQGVTLLDEGPFFQELREVVRQSSGREAFVFVHGFNTSFESAAKRTAQLHHDLRFDGAPMFYSWPSRGSPLQYPADTAAADRTVRRLEEFLRLVAKNTGASEIHLIAHSMGNRALVRALEEIGEDIATDGSQAPFGEVVMSAPDIDQAEFVDLAAEILPTAQRFTLYASQNDQALELSRNFHRAPRVGDAGDGLVVVPGVQTIDASTVRTELFSFDHDYFATQPSILNDIAGIVVQSLPVNARQGLSEERLPPDMRTYWRLISEP